MLWRYVHLDSIGHWLTLIMFIGFSYISERLGMVILNEPESAQYLEVRVDFMVSENGDGNVSWQKAQLFRTSSEEEKQFKYNMSIKIMLK